MARNRWLHTILKFGSEENPQIQWSWHPASHLSYMMRLHAHLATSSMWHTFPVLSRPGRILLDQMKHALQYAICIFHLRYWVACWLLWAGPCVTMKQVEWYCWSDMSIASFHLFIFYHSCSSHTCSQTCHETSFCHFPPNFQQAASRSLRRPPLVECKRDKSKVLQFFGPNHIFQIQRIGMLHILGSHTYGSTAAFATAESILETYTLSRWKRQGPGMDCGITPNISHAKTGPGWI